MSESVCRPKPVNVASVPHRSPFRYPGGKTWFVPAFRKWIGSMQKKHSLLIEPFAGGGTISLTAVSEHLVQHAIMVELDEEIAAVWQSISNGDGDWLAKRILEFDLTKENVTHELQKTDVDLKEKAFQTILKNRTFHRGILAEGAGFVKHGENGKGLRSRWYPATLAKRFSNLNQIAKDITFLQEDGLKIIEEYAEHEDVLFFIDPPYTAGGKKAGKRLYRHFELDHEQLFRLCESINGNFLMTYDNADEVKLLASKHGFQTRLIAMNNTHHATMEELVIGKELSWL